MGANRRMTDGDITAAIDACAVPAGTLGEQ
jgi:hypothetical protein